MDLAHTSLAVSFGAGWPRVRRALLIVVALIVGVAAWLLMPGPIEPLAWSPPPAPSMTGPMAPNQVLADARLRGTGRLIGAEDVAVDAQGRLYGGVADGRIMRLLPDGQLETFAATGGRPLGLDWHPNGNLIVADAFKGLLSVAPSGRVETLATSADGLPLGFTDDVDVARNGLIYFTDASSKYDQKHYIFDLLEARPHGRLLVHDIESGETRVLLDELYFANGVALSRKENFVLVNETWRYRITRYWLKGPKKGEHDVFADNLAGFPDGISANGSGRFWVAMPSPRKADVDAMHEKPWLKRLVARLPAALRPRAVPYGLVIGFDEDGTLALSLHDPGGQHLREITSVEEHDGYLYLGTLSNDRVGQLPLERLRTISAQ